MAHFGSSAWPNPYGRVAQIEKTAVLMRETTGDGAIEGDDKLTYAVERSGLYSIGSYLKVSEASDAATSHALSARMAYNDGSAVSVVTVGDAGVVPGTLDGKVLNAGLRQSATIYAVKGTNIVLTVLSTVTGAKTAGVGETTTFLAINAI